VLLVCERVSINDVIIRGSALFRATFRGRSFLHTVWKSFSTKVSERGPVSVLGYRASYPYWLVLRCIRGVFPPIFAILRKIGGKPRGYESGLKLVRKLPRDDQATTPIGAGRTPRKPLLSPYL
jgi:hypothetical protein